MTEAERLALFTTAVGWGRHIQTHTYRKKMVDPAHLSQSHPHRLTLIPGDSSEAPAETDLVPGISDVFPSDRRCI